MFAIKRILSLVLIALGTMSIEAQTMRQIWIDMPDEMVPYLNQSNRTELADYVDMKVDAAIRNKLEDTTRIERLTPEYIRVKLNASHRLEMRLLQKADGSKILCVVNTWLGPAADSKLSFYDADWHQLADISVPTATNDQLCFRPEGMSQERYAELLAMLDPLLTEIVLSETDDTITFRRSVPIVSNDDLPELKSILHDYVVKALQP